MGQETLQAVLFDLSVKATVKGADPSVGLMEKSAVMHPPKPMSGKPVNMQSWRIREKKAVLKARGSFREEPLPDCLRKANRSVKPKRSDLFMSSLLDQ
jgi:hypothetical protein